MADEINRASPRTQSALLQAMQEQRVAIGGVEHALPRPFHVLATQNPIEQEGTYPLPEAQLDRFLLEVNVSYPDLAAERTMLLATTGAHEARPVQAMTADDLVTAQALVRRLPVGEKVVDAILALVRGCRPETRARRYRPPPCRLGSWPARRPGADAGIPGPRPSRRPLAPSIDDVAALARPVLRHRMALSFSARADGIALPDLIDRLVGKIG